MKKKKLKKMVDVLQRDVSQLALQVGTLRSDIAKHQCHCENYKPKTVKFHRFLPITEVSLFGEGKDERKASGETRGETD